MYGNNYNPFTPNGFNSFGQFTPGMMQPNNQNDKTQQSPIQNIFTNQPPQQNSFMACFVKDGENVTTEGVYHKTAFIDIKHKKLTIKELNGDMVEYGLILPLDEKDIKIQELENKLEKMSYLEEELRKMKEMIANEQPNITDDSTSDKITKSSGNIKKSNSK